MGRFHDLPKRFEGNNKQYHIYALIDPRDSTIRYIGMSKDARVRLYQHLRTGCGRRTMRWIKELEQSGMRPSLHILETIDMEDNISSMAFRLVAYEREAYWIDKYLNLGAPLLNTLGVTRRYPQLGNNRTLPSRDKSTIHIKPPPIATNSAKEHVSLSFSTKNVFMRLDRLIEEALMTQKEVADETRLSPGTVSRMVNGHATSRLSVRKVLALLMSKTGSQDRNRGR